MALVPEAVKWLFLLLTVAICMGCIDTDSVERPIIQCTPSLLDLGRISTSDDRYYLSTSVIITGCAEELASLNEGDLEIATQVVEEELRANWLTLARSDASRPLESAIARAINDRIGSFTLVSEVHFFNLIVTESESR